MKKLNYLFCILSLSFVLIFVLIGCKNEKTGVIEYDLAGVIEYDLDGYEYHIELSKNKEACFYIPSNGKEINIPEEITVKHGMFSEKYIINEIYFDYDFYANGEDLDPNCLKTNIIVPKTVSSIRKKGFGKYTYAKFNNEDIDFFVSNVGGISVVNDNPYFDSREDSNCIIETKTDKIIISGLKNTKIPSTVKEIGSFAFWYIDYTELTELIIPSNVKKIDSFAFIGNDYLHRLIIEEGVEEIEPYAFLDTTVFYEGRFDCPINELYIPSTLKKLSTNSFYMYDMNGSTNIYYNGSDFDSLIYDKYTGDDVSKGIGLTKPNNGDAYFELTGNENIFRANIYLYSEKEPETDGNYWHYVDGNIQAWE